MSGTRKLAAILAADVVGFSRLAGADEERTLARLRALRSDLIDPTIAVHHGRVVKRTGDGAIVEFRSVVDAVRCAIEVQHGMVERNAGLPPERRIEFRIGVHLGDVVEESDGDLMGDGVNIAARLEGVAEPGAICLSEDAYRQVKARLDLQVSDLGARQLKNIVEPMRVFALQVGSAVEPVSAAAVKAKPEPEAAAPPRADSGRPSVAVLPFANMSADPEQEYFADGISEDIITALSKLPQLFVIARNSAFTFKGRNVLVPEVAKTLGVRYVLEGSVRKSGSRVRITAQLIDAVSGGHLWAERFDRELADIFAVQDEVTAKIVAEMAVNLTPGERRSLAAERTGNFEAYDCFLRGREAFFRTTREANREAQAHCERAIELDPAFAPAHAFLAATHAIDWQNGWGASLAQSRELWERSARRAAELDRSYPYTLWALALLHLWSRRHEEALATIEDAIASNPSFADGHIILGLVLHYSGRSAEALKCFERAESLNPVYPDMWLHFRAQALYHLGRFAEAAEALKRRIARNPETDISRVVLAASYAEMGLIEEARAAWADVLRVNPGYSLERRRGILPYKNPADGELVIASLRKAGIAQ
jgi:adenylate cyclase